jgi:type II secretory pathway pseudopilin PulG
MDIPPARARRGQVVVMVTLALIAMIGMLGLAVDLGWSYFVKKSAQAAADSAAMAAALEAYKTAGPSAPYTGKCGVSLVCAVTPVSCPGSMNLTAGCLYAQQNGFAVGGHSGQQNVTIADNAEFPPSAPPTAPGTSVYYWVTTRTAERIPQLFAAIFGNSSGLVSARATAAIASIPFPGVLYGLNIITDPGPFGTGVDISMTGGHGQNWIKTEGSIYMASEAHGPSTWAGETSGTGTVEGGNIFIYGEGTVKEPGTYTPTPENLDNFEPFSDPVEKATRLVGQPSAPDQLDAPLHAVAGGTIAGDCTNPPTVNSGTYYATDPRTGAPTGGPIRVAGCVNFGTAGQLSFNDFVFVGGLHFGDTGSQVKIAPGRYFVAGAQRNTDIFYMRNGVSITDYTDLVNGEAQPSQDLGEILVFTDQNYPGLPIPTVLKQQLDALGLGYGRVEVQTGNTEGSELSLHGLTRDPVDKVSLPGNLQHFSPVVFYVDQGNSIIDYDNGVLQKLGDPGCTAEPCLSDTAELDDPMMILFASPNFDVFGTVYLPRGASLQFQGSGNIDAPVQFIAGTYGLRGGAQINPRPLTPGFALMKTVLVE